MHMHMQSILCIVSKQYSIRSFAIDCSKINSTSHIPVNIYAQMSCGPTEKLHLKFVIVLHPVYSRGVG